MKYSALVMFYGLDLVIVHDFVLLNVKSPSKKKKNKNKPVSIICANIHPKYAMSLLLISPALPPVALSLI